MIQVMVDSDKYSDVVRIAIFDGDTLLTHFKIDAITARNLADKMADKALIATP